MVRFKRHNGLASDASRISGRTALQALIGLIDGREERDLR